MWLRARGAVLASAVLFLAACGGGGGGGGGGGSSGPGTQPANHAPHVVTQAAGDVAMEDSQIKATMGGSVRLDASASTDDDHDALSYQWSVTSQPAGGNAPATVSGARLEWQPNVLGTFAFSVSVTDARGATSSQSVSIVVDNRAPVAAVRAQASFTAAPYAAPARAVAVGALVTLDASGSQDPDGHAVAVTFAMTQKPSGSYMGLNASGGSVSFVADLAGEYRVKVVGVDPSGASFESTYVYNASEQAPRPVIVTPISDVHDGGSNSISASVGHDVLLYGSRTDGTWLPTSQSWRMDSRPAGSAATLSSTSGAYSGFTPDVQGDYLVTLAVTDMLGATSTYSTTVHVNSILPQANILASAASGPLANAATLTVLKGAMISLDGSGSVDPDAGTVSYSWTLVSDPHTPLLGLQLGPSSAVARLLDIEGTWTFRLRVTNGSGAFSERDIKIKVVTQGVMASIDRSSLTLKLGGSAQLSAAQSKSLTGGALSYRWSLDAKPVTSTASLGSSASRVSFTPDVAGTYVLAVRVDDGVQASIAYVAVRAVPNFNGPVALNFVPGKAALYSRGLDKVVMLSESPQPSLRIVDPFSGVVRTVILPKASWRMKLSPDGRLAAIMHSDAFSLVDIDSATLLNTAETNPSPETVDVSNAGVVWMRVCCYAPVVEAFQAVDGRTGAVLDRITQGRLGGGDTIYVDRFNAIVMGGTFDSWYYIVDPVSGKFLSYDTLQAPPPILLSEDQSLYLSGDGVLYDTLSRTQIAALTGHSLNFSLSPAADEMISIAQASDWPAFYSRFAGPTFQPAADVPLPMVNGLQSYGIQVFHSATGVPVVLVQTGTASKSASTGVNYHLITR